MSEKSSKDSLGSGSSGGTGGDENEKDPGRKYQEFKKISDPFEARILLREGAKLTSSAIIWTKDQGQVMNSHITNYSSSELAIYFRRPSDPEFNLAHFEREIASASEAHCYFSISLPRANIFFRAKYLGSDPAGLKFEVPVDVFNVQRRRDVRFPIPPDFTLKVDFDDPFFADSTLTKKVIDISASGMAFVGEADEEPLYQVGLKLKNMTVTIKGRKITADGEVRHARKIKNKLTGKEMVKVGIQFTSIRPGESQIIANYVFEETRKFYTKLM